MRESKDRAAMAMTYSDTDSTIRKRSGWLIPLAVLVITVVLSALILVYYLAPSPQTFVNEQPAPTSDSRLVALRVHGLKLWIPANYIQFESVRQGGARRDISLVALLPDLAGWSNAEAATFADNTADSPVIYLLIRDEEVNRSEADRLARIYLNYVTDQNGTAGPFGLTQYTFRDDSGYRSEDLFVGQTAAGPVILRCVRFSPQVPSPSCLRDTPIDRKVALSYRFKRAHLARWREIGDTVATLIAGFKKAPKSQADAEPQPRP
ncbi:MAG: hypothetical protein ISS15_13390 [Alphaproteobacteria bacterium]|nr:hypothetical protein [Alphaproteobacteria bacterium]MBL7098647.1 hypothetical protein [Alphaproteobacteria bacterium]